MKENYTSKQDRKIIKLARRYKISPADVMTYLDKLHDMNFEVDLEIVEQIIMEEILNYALYDRTNR